MNVPAAVSSLFRRHPDEWLPLFWLAAACVLGLVWSLVHASGLMAGVPLPWPAGRLMFSFYGALVYGWALPVLFSFMAENGCRRLKPAEWLWHLCVVLGMTTIMAGDGSGLLLMPFDWWVCPVFAILAAGARRALRGSGFRGGPCGCCSALRGCTAAALLALGLYAGFVHEPADAPPGRQPVLRADVCRAGERRRSIEHGQRPRF